MVIIITGATHAGKTCLAQKLLEQLYYPYVSQDHIKMGLIRSGITTLTPENDREMTGFLWPITCEMIKTAIENHQNLIVEGCYVPFDWEKSFSQEYLKEIQYFCLAFSDEYIENHFSSILAHGNDMECRGDDSYCTIETIKKENHFFIEGCRLNSITPIIIQKQYEQTILNEVLHKIN